MKKILLLATLGNTQDPSEPPGGLCFDDPIFEDFCKQDDFCQSENRDETFKLLTLPLNIEISSNFLQNFIF